MGPVIRLSISHSCPIMHTSARWHMPGAIGITGITWTTGRGNSPGVPGMPMLPVGTPGTIRQVLWNASIARHANNAILPHTSTTVVLSIFQHVLFDFWGQLSHKHWNPLSAHSTFCYIMYRRQISVDTDGHHICWQAWTARTARLEAPYNIFTMGRNNG